MIKKIDNEKEVEGLKLINVGKIGKGEVEKDLVKWKKEGEMIMIESVNGREI